jgi:hypothetical protein
LLLVLLLVQDLFGRNELGVHRESNRLTGNLVQIVKNQKVVYGVAVPVEIIAFHLVCDVDIKQLVQDTEKGDFISWDDIEERFKRFDLEYPKTRFAHALHILALLYGKKQFDQDMLDKINRDHEKLSDKIKKQIIATRTKDFENKFRKNVIEEDSMHSCDLIFPV